MDVGLWMSADVLEHKLECARDGKSPEVTWNTRRAPTKLGPGWTNRLFVACGGRWLGYFPLAGEVLWNPDDERAPWALIFDARGWTRIAPVPAPRFRGWRYVEAASLGVTAIAAEAPPASNLALEESLKDSLKKRARSAESTSPPVRSAGEVPPLSRKDHPTRK